VSNGIVGISVALVLFSLCMGYLRSSTTYGYAGTVGVFTAAVVALGPIGDPSYALSRISQTMIGILVFITVWTFIWPQSASDLMQQNVHCAVADIKEWLITEFSLPPQDDNKDYDPKSSLRPLSANGATSTPQPAAVVFHPTVAVVVTRIGLRDVRFWTPTITQSVPTIVQSVPIFGQFAAPEPTASASPRDSHVTVEVGHPVKAGSLPQSLPSAPVRPLTRAREENSGQDWKVVCVAMRGIAPKLQASLSLQAALLVQADAEPDLWRVPFPCATYRKILALENRVFRHCLDIDR
jgi:hypothetical protein